MTLAGVVLVLVGCGGTNGGGTDGGVDSSTQRQDAAAIDGGDSRDAGAVTDASTPVDAGTDGGATADAAAQDGGISIDAGTDAGTADAGTDSGPEDGGTDAGPSTHDAGPSTHDAGPDACTLDTDCVHGSYCAKADGDCSGTGTCTPRPDLCPSLFSPVCGCDGNDYSNYCTANRVGVNVAHSGACTTTSCAMPPRHGCCFDDGDCTHGTHCVGETCVAGGEGTCVDDTLGAGECWESSDCGPGGVCAGVNRCSCGAACFAPDSPGTCAAAAL